MAYYILVCALSFFVWIGICHLLDLEEFWPAGFVLALFSTLAFSIFEIVNESEKCREFSKPYQPKIVHVSDSSEKIFKYERGNNVYEIRVKKNDPYFHTPESLIFVDTCFEKLILKNGE